MEIGTKKADLHTNISHCSVQMLNWMVLGPQGLAPIIFLMDYFDSANNGFYFVYRTNHAEASILKCHTCPELPLNVIRVHVNVMIHYGHTVKSDNLALNDSMQPKVAYEDFYRDVYCSVQDDSDSVYNHNGTALVDLVHDSNNINNLTNPDSVETTFLRVSCLMLTFLIKNGVT